MKAIILAGGRGSRLAEETSLVPKPMVEIGGKPILWHIMRIYSAYGIDEFIVALGYKAEVVKKYFLNFFAITNDLSLDLNSGRTVIHDGNQPNWKIHLVDTGLDTQTGSRLKRLEPWLDADDTFMLTYGDGVSNVDIRCLLAFHRRHGKLATVTAVNPPARFGRLVFAGDRVAAFTEKPHTSEDMINGGFFVLNRGVMDYIADRDSVAWEGAPLEDLATDGQLMGYRHEGFWQPMDTLRDRLLLEKMWESGCAPWKVW